LEFVAKELVDLAEAAVLAEPPILEVIGLNLQAGGDVRSG